MRSTSLLAIGSIGAFLTASPALAALDAAAPAGGGLPAVSVHVDLTASSVTVGDLRVPIALERSELPSERDVVTQTVAIGSGRQVVHVRIPTQQQDGRAWELVVAGGKSQPIFAGVTGLTAGDPGERTGTAVRILPGGDKNFVVVGAIREDLRICGQDVTLLDPQALYPSSLDLRPATVQRLDPDRLALAQRIDAVDKGAQTAPPLARLLVSRGSSVPGSRGLELTDGRPTTAWSEERPGMGQGEFVVMAAPKDVPIGRMQIVLPASSQDPDTVAPKSLYLATETAVFQVVLPEGAASKPGEVYEFAFPKPLTASCISLVLGDAYSKGRPHPTVSVAELVAYSEFDAPGATLDDVAKQLTGPRGLAAAQVLERAEGSLAAVERAYDKLDERGRAHAIDVAASHDPCKDSAPLLSRALCEPSGEARRKAHEKLERCKGAVDALATKLRQDASSRACIAPTLAVLAGPGALDAIADALAATDSRDAGARAVLREAFAVALQGAEAGRLAALVGDEKVAPRARLEMMRAAGVRVAEATGEGERTLTEIFASQPSMRDRFVAVGPMAELARAGNQVAERLMTDTLTHDADWPVRARAAEASAALPPLQSALLVAARDAEPRVREAALQSLQSAPNLDAIRLAGGVLAQDSWPFVKVQAIGLLARAQPSSEVDGALAGALKDASARVRGASILALGRHRALPWRKAVRERLDDEHEEGEVRAASARVLGALCDTESIDRLTEYAVRLGAAGTTDDDQQVAIAALEALAAMQPRDLADRLSPLRKPGVVPTAVSAARRAMSARGICR